MMDQALAGAILKLMIVALWVAICLWIRRASAASGGYKSKGVCYGDFGEGEGGKVLILRPNQSSGEIRCVKKEYTPIIMFDEFFSEEALEPQPDDELVECDESESVVAPSAKAAVKAKTSRMPSHRLGENLSADTVLRIQASLARKRATEMQEKIESLTNAMKPSFSLHCARVAFGRMAAEDRKVINIIGGGSAHMHNAKHGNASYDSRNCLQYGVVSFVHAQASGLAAFIGGSDRDGELLHTIASQTVDDSQMWVKDPATAADRAAGIRSEGRRYKGMLWKRGRSISLPVCNHSEFLITRRRYMDDTNSIDVLRGCNVISAPTALCSANAPTVYDRWVKTCAFLVTPAGERIDPDGVIEQAKRRTGTWHTAIVCKDNLALNNNLTGMQERVLLDQLRSGFEDELTAQTLFDANCSCHSCVLSTKPAIDRMDKLPGKMTRMGHLHENGRISALHLKYVEKRVKAKFRFEPCKELPPELERWKREAKTILRNSRAGLDLTEEQEDVIIEHDNGSWGDLEFRHFCLGKTRCKCGGNRSTALQMMVDNTKQCNGCVPDAPLQYRWKGVERFTARLYRGLRHHQLWLHTARDLWPPERTKKSEAALTALGGEDSAPHNNDTSRFKQEVRGARTYEFLAADPQALLLERALVLNCGVQGYLNKCFKADATVTKYCEQLQVIPPSHRQVSEELLKLREECIKRNLSILSGDSGRDAISEYCTYFFFNSEVWECWRLDNYQRFASCLDLIVVMQDMFYRLIWRMDTPRNALLDVCNITEGDMFDPQAVEGTAGDVWETLEACPDCVDSTFTRVWAYRLLHAGVVIMRKAHVALRDIVAVARICSNVVEKLHLVGQEARPRKRGVAVTCDNLGPRCLRHLATAAADAHRASAVVESLGGNKSLVKPFMQCLAQHTCSGHNDRRLEDNSSAVQKKRQVRSRSKIRLRDAQLERMISMSPEITVTSSKARLW